MCGRYAFFRWSPAFAALEAAQAAWLDPQASPQTLQALLGQVQPALRERPLATLVNDPQLDAPECLTPAN